MDEFKCAKCKKKFDKTEEFLIGLTGKFYCFDCCQKAIQQLEDLKSENERLKEDKEILYAELTQFVKEDDNGEWNFDISTPEIRLQIIESFVKRIKSLRQQLKEKDEEIKNLTVAKDYYHDCWQNDTKENIQTIKKLFEDYNQLDSKAKELKKENKQLKQSQNEKAKEVLQRARESIIEIKVIKQKDFKLEIAAGDMRYECLKIIDQLQKELEDE